MRKLPPKDVLAGVRRGGSYVRGLWVRLNGGGKSDFGQPRLPEGLPLPTSTKVGRQWQLSRSRGLVDWEFVSRACPRACRCPPLHQSGGPVDIKAEGLSTREGWVTGESVSFRGATAGASSAMHALVQLSGAR